MMRVYGSCISYYTGKLEAYLRYKEIPYEFVTMTTRARRRVAHHTGASQMPAVELPDGRWMTDTTPMIAWFETQHPEPAVIPHEPLLAFLSRLVEDYAEEWHWRPAMHYRWSYSADRQLLGRRIAGEVMSDIPLPGALKRWLIRQRQYRFYVRGDGVSSKTRAHVEGVYLKSLRHLESIFEHRPFLLGERPSLADFGFFAPMFRHFAQDPTPSEIMRRRAPRVYDWQARLWDARASSTHGELLQDVPEDWGPFLEEIGSAYLPFMNANALAWSRKQKRFDVEIQGTTYTRVPVSRYRVWCLSQLRANCDLLDDDAKSRARSLLTTHGCWEPLWEAPADARYDDASVPFRGLKVHYDKSV